MAAPRLGIRTSIIAGVILCWALASTAFAAPLVILAPDWSDIPTDTQQILAPLGPEWNELESVSRRKWLQVAERYPMMSKSQQVRVQRRMRDWAKLTPEQRRLTREKYRNVKQAPPEQREALKQMWSEYQALPDEEKKRLKRQSTATPGSPAAAPGATGGVLK